MTNKELIKKAIEAKKNSYAPYSNYNVGAAVLAKSGKVYVGVNVENCAYGGHSICAERVALYSAFANGEREFEKIAIVGSSDGIAYPCGMCRQVMIELAYDIDVICAKDENTYEVHKLKNILPHAFTPKDTDCTKKWK